MKERNKYIYLIVAPSGTGKTEFCKILQERYKLRSIASYTTRMRRYEGEIGHTFVTKEEFDALPNKVAYTLYDDNEYCATQEQVDNADLYIIDVAGVEYFFKTYKGNKKPIVVRLWASEITRMFRMTLRGDDMDNVERRLKTDQIEFADFDYDISINAEMSLDAMVVSFFMKTAIMPITIWIEKLNRYIDRFDKYVQAKLEG